MCNHFEVENSIEEFLDFLPGKTQKIAKFTTKLLFSKPYALATAPSTV